MNDAARYLRLLAKPVVADARTITRQVIIPPTEDLALEQERADVLLAGFEAHTNGLKIAPEYLDTLKKNADTGLNRLSSEGPQAQLSSLEAASLEAIVVIEGIRPVVDFIVRGLDLEGTRLGEWDSITRQNAARIEQAALSVGRIDCDGRHFGTGFLVSDHAIMTNRHVLEQLATFDEGCWQFRSVPTISFGAEGDGDAFPLLQEGIEVDHGEDGRDYALISLGPSPSRADLAPPLVLEETSAYAHKSRPVYVLGYPGKPMPGSERFSVLLTLFNCEYGRKRYSPGEISGTVGTLDETSDPSVFGHDCTTLGGSSGSPVIDLGETSTTVVGIHFAGIKRVSNFAYSLASLRAGLEDGALNYA
jgi:V8-like Glu-specific endopeptidase